MAWGHFCFRMCNVLVIMIRCSFYFMVLSRHHIEINIILGIVDF